MPRETILPRTVVPAYLDETPLSVQPEKLDYFPTDLPHQEQAGHKPSFPRPSVEDQLQMIEDNLGHLDGYYFDMRWRKQGDFR